MLFRTDYMWWIMVAFWGFIVLLTAGAALNPDVPVLGRIVCAAIAMVIGGWLAYARRAGIKVDQRQVAVRRYSGMNIAVDWDDVSGFELVPTGGLNSSVYVAVVLTDGRRLTTQGLCAGSEDSRKGQQLIADLEAMRPSPV